MTPWNHKPMHHLRQKMSEYILLHPSAAFQLDDSMKNHGFDFYHLPKYSGPLLRMQNKCVIAFNHRQPQKNNLKLQRFPSITHDEPTTSQVENMHLAPCNMIRVSFKRRKCSHLRFEIQKFPGPIWPHGKMQGI